jgi:MerR family copper efflux transcriptional regulator
MPTELPIACSLSATELPARLAQMAELGRDALADVELSGTHATVRFAAGAGVRERVTSVVAAEAACCAFLTIQVSDEPDTVVLDITAPEDAALVLHELVDAFRGEPRAAQ